MWIFTPTGFVSAVFKDGALQVRARDKDSLENLAELAQTPIIRSPLADYPYRVSINHEQFTQWLTGQAMNIHYSNFKSEVADVKGYGYARPLNKVWDVMHEVEDEGARVRN